MNGIVLIRLENGSWVPALGLKDLAFDCVVAVAFVAATLLLDALLVRIALVVRHALRHSKGLPSCPLDWHE
ncbi:hypothetical protein E4U55_002165, partial [Claviceps digitariae]